MTPQSLAPPRAYIMAHPLFNLHQLNMVSILHFTRHFTNGQKHAVNFLYTDYFSLQYYITCPLARFHARKSALLDGHFRKCFQHR
jgi:hypothetical protein